MDASSVVYVGVERLITAGLMLQCSLSELLAAQVFMGGGGVVVGGV